MENSEAFNRQQKLRPIGLMLERLVKQRKPSFFLSAIGRGKTLSFIDKISVSKKVKTKHSTHNRLVKFCELMLSQTQFRP